MSAAQIGSTPPVPPQQTPPAAARRPASASETGAAQHGDSNRPAAQGKGELHEALVKIEQLVSPAARDLRFSIDEDTGITVIKLIDTQTQTVLRQIPTEEVIEISKALDKLQGLLVKEKA